MFNRIADGIWWDRALSLNEGCSPVSAGCLHCWSESSAHMRSFQKNPKMGARYGGVTDSVLGKWTGKIKLLEENLDKPGKVKKPMVWAVWNDLFHGKVPTEFIARVFQKMEFADQHIFMVLTKRPVRMKKFLERYPIEVGLIRPRKHIFIGTTLEDQTAVRNGRVDILRESNATSKFLSIEPLLEPIDEAICRSGTFGFYGIDWVIVGGESGASSRPCRSEWIKEIIAHCHDTGIPVFVKQLGNNDGERRHRSKRSDEPTIREVLGCCPRELPVDAKEV